MVMHREVPGEASTRGVLSDLLLLCCLAAFTVGIVVAAAALMSVN
jgi:hypothetical protein